METDPRPCTGPVAGLAQTHIEEAAGGLQSAMTGEFIPPHGPFGVAKRTMVSRQPFGVVLAIAPHNAPFILGMRSVIYALAAGNTVVMKTSEYSPRVHNCVADLLIEAGLPEGVLNVIHIDPKDAPEVVERLVAHKDIAFVNFTGSTRVGRILGSLCGKYVKPSLMELGGKGAL